MMMGKFAVAAAMAGCGVAGAQSAITVYGNVDAGITYTNNSTVGGGHGAAVQFMGGGSQGDRIGFRGSEDLGGGTKALFTLESGFMLANGGPTPGSGGFNRGSFVGLSGRWGELTLGHQYDFLGWYFPAYAIAANTPAGLLAWSLPAYAAGGYALDNRVWGARVSNSVKYLTPTVAGFNAAVQYGFGEIAGSPARKSTADLVVNYASGPFSASVAYYSQRNAVNDARKSIAAAGAAYELGPTRLFGMVSDVRIHDAVGPRATTLDLGASHLLLPLLRLGGGYQFQWRNNGLGHASQLTASLDYLLSKRTDVYTVAAFGRDSAFAAQVAPVLGGPSTSGRQVALRVGIRHRF
ncbi:MAG: porin [Comamonas sp.]